MLQAAKILDENRSRAVAIKLRSMHCGMEDITQALYQMDFSKIELESLWGLYEIRGKKEELEKINTHVQTDEDGKGNTLISGGSRSARDACPLSPIFFFISMPNNRLAPPARVHVPPIGNPGSTTEHYQRRIYGSHREAHTTRGPIFLIFMHISGENWPNYRYTSPLLEFAPLSGKSWIRHCLRTKIFKVLLKSRKANNG